MSSEALHCVVPERREGRIGVESDQAEPASNNKLSVNWKVLAGLLISGVSLYIAVRSLEPTRVWEAFRAAQYRWIVPAVFLYLFALVARTARWRALLKDERCIPLMDLLPTMAMGRGANNIYPFRTGEIVRVLLLNRRHSVSVAGGFAAILVERIFDGLTMILFLLLAALIGGIPGYLRYVVWAASGVFGVALASVCAVVVWPSVVQQIADWFIDHLAPQRFWAQIKHIVERFIAGLSSIR
ncbi:MAG: flippase-like domain-containing protein, partial [Anaerolineae bacterium]|nr:flippase-like domain-containing protein [Anaerolineae bacterium]